jgi:hypothetical protein
MFQNVQGTVVMIDGSNADCTFAAGVPAAESADSATATMIFKE